jgi:hypothetical protein
MWTDREKTERERDNVAKAALQARRQGCFFFNAQPKV